MPVGADAGSCSSRRAPTRVVLEPAEIIDRVDIVRAANEARFGATAFRGAAQRIGQHALGPHATCSNSPACTSAIPIG